MDWNAETNRDLLKHIVAMLLALAGLADRASVMPRPVRCRVLAILRPAEAVAQASVIGTARDFGAPMPPQAYLAIGALMFTHEGDDPADAARLALRLRALAFALATLSMWAECFASRVAVGAKTDVLSKLTCSVGWRRQGIPARHDVAGDDRGCIEIQIRPSRKWRLLRTEAERT